MINVYKVSLKDHRSSAKKRLKDNEGAYDSLKNKNSHYARQILALQNLYRRVCEIYDNAPNEIK